jgi:hypothetical protein
VRRSLLAASVLVLVAAVPACGGGDDEAAPPTTSPPPVAPLTGLPDPGDEAATRSALWVKIGNNPEARPQTGLVDADVVFEEVAEGGITRFAAVYNSMVPERAGPVRSVRPMDVDLVKALLGIFAYSGGARGPTDMIESVPDLLTVDETRAAGEAMERSPDRRAPDNLYVIGDAMFARGGEPKPPQPLFEYLRESRRFGGEPVESFVVGFGEPVTYTWDPAGAVFLRSTNAGPFLGIDGVQISATNVIVQVTDYPNDSEGSTVGEGEVWVFSQGELIRGTWARPDPSEPATYLDGEGKVIRLTPGRTWVALLPTGRPVDVISPAPPSQ